MHVDKPLIHIQIDFKFFIDFIHFILYMSVLPVSMSVYQVYAHRPGYGIRSLEL